MEGASRRIRFMRQEVVTARPGACGKVSCLHLESIGNIYQAHWIKWTQEERYIGLLQEIRVA
jgi:hypothetical protein